jgi:hypothetical protein
VRISASVELVSVKYALAVNTPANSNDVSMGDTSHCHTRLPLSRSKK